MSVREYIGARYVPIFVGDWDNTKTYEPLSIVQNAGASYTSRQYVPAGVAISNTDYWACTGNYNAQVDVYRQEVQTLASEVAKIYDSLDDALANATSDEIYIRTLGYHTGSIEGGALYRVTDTTPAGYYEDNGSGLYFELIGADNVAQFGAIGDGLTDDTAAIQAAVDNLDTVNFIGDKTYYVSNILVSQSNKILKGNGCTLKGKGYAVGTLTAALNIGDTTITVNNPQNFNVNQTAFIYNDANDPKGFQIVITGKSGNVLTFKAYKPFRTDDTISDATPYAFPVGSTVYTGTTIITVMSAMNVQDGGTIENVTIRDFIFSQNKSLTGVVGWGQLAYGVICYETVNVKFENNFVSDIAALFLMFYGWNRFAKVSGNVFYGTTNSYAVCAHWDMADISLANRMADFEVIDNTFIDCAYGIIYSSVNGGICSGNRLLNDTTNHLGINIYGGDISLFKEYSGYTQTDYYTQNVIIADNVLKNTSKAGTAISIYGAKECKVIGNEIEQSNANITVCAAINCDIANNTIEYTYVGSNPVNSGIRTYGKVIGLMIHDNVFNAPRLLLIDSLHRTISTGVLDTDYWGYDDSTVFVFDNIVMQSDGTSVIYIAGTTETDASPSVLMDAPSLLMFDNNRVINSAKTSVTVFQLNATLQSFITDPSGLQVGQLCGYNNISYGLVSAASAFRPYIPFTGNVDMS